MKYIQKNQEPEEFIEWKNLQQPIGNCNYENLQNPQKRIVHESLLTEQGYICCYCCQEIEKNSSHIEHFDPQSKTNYDLSVDYYNLLASCGPYKQKKQKLLKHCGDVRGNLAIPVSPLQKDCENYFAYTVVGEIIPSPTINPDLQKDAQDTIDRLKLNHPNLIESRKFVAEVILDKLENITNEEVQNDKKYYQNLDQNGHYEAFCPVILYFLDKYFP